MDDKSLIPHLFRSEAGRIISVLCRQFGLEHIEVAEDITSDTFVAALESWPYKGRPENPVAWLYAVAKNKAKNYIAREQLFQTKVSKNLHQPDSQDPVEPEWSESGIHDSQLQMLFAISDQRLPPETQVCLALNILCGFGVQEIATALLTTKEATAKRIQRGKQSCRDLQIILQLPGPIQMQSRLPIVLNTLYLLFSEGWHSETNEQAIRKELCAEAMRLTTLLATHSDTRSPAVHALYALMCFQASRLDARNAADGSEILYDDQDQSQWTPELIAEGALHLNLAASGDQLTTYHLEAMIAYYHTNKELRDQHWETILQLYNRLLQLHYSPVAALNRTYALYRVQGPQQAIREAEKLKLQGNIFYFLLLAELYKEVDSMKALEHLSRAAELAKTRAQRALIERRQSEWQR